MWRAVRVVATVGLRSTEESEHISGFEVVAGQIRSAATQMKAAADGVTGADPSADVGEVGTALPGSRSAAAASTLVNAWKTRFRSWHDDGMRQSEDMTASADTYDATDYNADQRLRVLMRRTGETIH